MRERRAITLGQRWRREANRGVDDRKLEQTLATLPSIRQPTLRVRAGSIHAEMEGAMGSINEVSTCAGDPWVATAPRIAKLLDSVPPEVNRTSSSAQPSNFATRALAVSTAACARRP